MNYSQATKWQLDSTGPLLDMGTPEFHCHLNIQLGPLEGV